MNVVILGKRTECGDSAAKRLYCGYNGNERLELHVTETRNRIEVAKTFFEKAGVLSGRIDLIHVDFNGLPSLNCCEYAMHLGIPYVLCLLPCEGGRAFSADWEKRYFEWFAKRSLLTIIPDSNLNLSENLPIVVVGCDGRLDDLIFKEILCRMKDWSPVPIYDSMDLLQCGDPKCLGNLRIAVNHLGDSDNSLRLLSYGGQGMVYTMHSKRLRRDVAIKVPNYPKRRPERYQTMERTLLKEARLLKQCNDLGSKCVPTFRGCDPSGKYVARDFIDGRCLSEILKTHHTFLATGSQILGGYVDATEELFHVFHDLMGVVIKDYKARNIILSETTNGLVFYLVDLGSCLTEKEIPFKSTDNRPKLGGGDFLHWAPEVLLNQFKQCDRRLDYFSFGVTCFRIITGDHPYSNTEPDPGRVRGRYEIEYRIAVKKLESSEAARNIDPDLLRFIVDSLNPDCLKRPRKWYRPKMVDRKEILEQLHMTVQERLEKNHGLDTSICKVAADKPAFILSSYCAWLVGQCLLNNIHHLYFLSRDGFILRKITEIFAQKMDLDLQCDYLYASRQSTRILSIKTIDQDALKWLRKKPKGGTVTLGLILKRLALDDDPVIRAILKDLQMGPETTEADKITAFLGDGRFLNRVRAYVRREKRIARRYFETSGLLDNTLNRFALVDLGWQGRIPLAIRKTLGLRQLMVFYFGNLNPEGDPAIDIRAMLFNKQVRTDWFDFFDNTIATDFVEIMASADHKTLLHYGDLCEFLPENVKDVALAEWGISEYHRTILAYANALGADDINRLDGIADRELVFQKIKELTLSPSSMERKVFGDYPYCSEQTDSLKRPFRTTMGQFFLGNME